MATEVPRWVRRGVVATAATLGGLTALIGVAHTDWGRPLLAFMPGYSGCPVDMANIDPDEAEAQRVTELGKRTGTAEAGAHPAGDLELGVSGRVDVERWAAQAGLTCTEAMQGRVLACQRQVECGTGEDWHLRLDGEDRLVAVDRFRSGATADGAVKELRSKVDVLNGQVGPATEKHGELTTRHLEGQRFAYASVKWAYRDYTAKVSGMNVAPGRVRIREQYQWRP